MNGTTLVNKIDQVLKERNSKRQELADFCGITTQAITDWYKRGSIPSALLAQKIADFLGVSIDWLLRDEYENNWTEFVDLDGQGKVSLSPREIMRRIIDHLEAQPNNGHDIFSEKFFSTITDIISINEIRAYKANRNEPTIRQLWQISERLNLPLTYLLTGQFTTDINNPDSYIYSLAQQFDTYLRPLNCLHDDEKELIRLMIEKLFMNRVNTRKALFNKGIDTTDIPELN